MKNNKGIVFLVGPSGIGKTTILKEVSKSLSYDAMSLDDLVAAQAKEQGIIDKGNAYTLFKSLGGDSFFLFGLDCLFRFLEKKSNRKIIIDVGAAFQNQKLLSSLSKFYTVVCISAEPRAAFQRFSDFRNSSRNLISHCSTEFSPTRVEVYDSANFFIDSTGMTVKETLGEVERVILESNEGES